MESDSDVVASICKTSKADKRSLPYNNASLLAIAPKKKFLKDYQKDEDSCDETKKKSHEFMETFFQKKIYIDETVMGFYDKNNPDSRNMSPAKYHYSRCTPVGHTIIPPDSRNMSPAKYHYSRCTPVGHTITPHTSRVHCKDELPLNLSVRINGPPSRNISTSSVVSADNVKRETGEVLTSLSSLVNNPPSNSVEQNSFLLSGSNKPLTDVTQRSSLTSTVTGQLAPQERTSWNSRSAFELYQKQSSATGTPAVYQTSSFATGTPAVDQKPSFATGTPAVDQKVNTGLIEIIEPLEDLSPTKHIHQSDEHLAPKIRQRIHQRSLATSGSQEVNQADVPQTPMWHEMKRRWSFDSSHAQRSVLALKTLKDLSCPSCDTGVLGWYQSLKDSWDDIPLMRSCYCLTCHTSFSNAEALTQHRLSIHNDPASFNIEYRCIFCPEIFQDSILFSQHTKHHEKENLCQNQSVFDRLID